MLIVSGFGLLHSFLEKKFAKINDVVQWGIVKNVEDGIDRFFNGHIGLFESGGIILHPKL